MPARYTRPGKYFLTLIGAGLIIASCSSMHKQINLSSTSALVWPARPDNPRVGYVASFNHPEHFGIQKGFLTWLGEVFTGEKDRKMIRPMAVVQTSNNVLYVADPGVKGVHCYNLKDKSYVLIRLENDNVLPSPVGLAVDKNDTVYIVDSELAKVFKVLPGSTVATIVDFQENLSQPTSIAINSSDNSIYITDTSEHHIKYFSADGKLISVIGKRGKGKGEFNYPTTIWHDKAGKLYVTDTLNFRIQLFDDKGQYVSNFGKQGDSSGNLSRPKGVATDNDGHVYVVDSLFHLFQLFNHKGNFLLHVGGQGQNEGEFWLPSGIFINNNLIYIADSHNQRVQVFRYLGDRS